MSSYASPPKTSGAVVFVAAEDIIVEVTAVVVEPPHVIIREVLLVDHVGVPVVGYPGCVYPSQARC